MSDDYKKRKIKHGKSTIKEAEADPWEVPCADLVRPCQIPRKGKSDLLQFKQQSIAEVKVSQVSNNEECGMRQSRIAGRNPQASSII
jgi:hypothetical protein